MEERRYGLQEVDLRPWDGYSGYEREFTNLKDKTCTKTSSHSQTPSDCGSRIFRGRTSSSLRSGEDEGGYSGN